MSGVFWVLVLGFLDLVQFVLTHFDELVQIWLVTPLLLDSVDDLLSNIDALPEFGQSLHGLECLTFSLDSLDLIPVCKLLHPLPQLIQLFLLSLVLEVVQTVDLMFLELYILLFLPSRLLFL